MSYAMILFGNQELYDFTLAHATMRKKGHQTYNTIYFLGEISVGCTDMIDFLDSYTKNKKKRFLSKKII